jgi:hypothetical protein
MAIGAGLLMFLNSGLSMLQYRRSLTEKAISVPLDVLTEVIIALLLLSASTIWIFTQDLRSISIVNFNAHK